MKFISTWKVDERQEEELTIIDRLGNLSAVSETVREFFAAAHVIQACGICEEVVKVESVQGKNGVKLMRKMSFQGTRELLSCRTIDREG